MMAAQIARRVVSVLGILQILLPFATCQGKLEENRAKDVEELFRGRIEAPNKTHILDNIFKGYDKRIRPYYREKPITVSLYAVIDSFHDIREDQMEYKTELVVKESWKDPRLVYGNESWFVKLKNDMLKKLWYPDTFIENSRKHDIDEESKTAYLFGDGTIFFSEWIKATLTSHMDFSKYPMDVQTLKLQIAAYSYDDRQVQYQWTKVHLREHDITEFYVEKPTLKMEATSFITGTSGTHTAAIAEFIIRRRLPHYIMGFYLPCIACTTASWLQFWMDQTAVGDRACLGITTVLTEIFLLEFSNQGMPKVSYMKAAELFLIVSFSFIFLALVESAIVYKATFWSLLKERKKKRVKKTGEPGETNKNHTPQTLCDGNSPDTSSTRSGIPEHDASIYEQTVIKSTEYILREVAGSKGTGPPVNLSTSAVGFIACNWGLMIDRGARLLFPLTYAAFIVTYFSFFHF